MNWTDWATGLAEEKKENTHFEHKPKLRPLCCHPASTVKLWLFSKILLAFGAPTDKTV